MIVSIHQPNFMPYQGYFNKIKDSDLFVIYDTAQYVKDRWDNRNRIRNKLGDFYITVPLLKKYSDKKRFYEVLMPEDNKWKKKHLNSLRASYSKTVYFDILFNFLEKHYDSSILTLSEFNSKIIIYLMDVLEIKTEIVYSSQLGLDESLKSTKALIQIVKKVGATDYLSGPSGKKYLDVDLFSESQIGLKFQSFNCPIYEQPFDNFISHLSVLDLIFNKGNSAKDFI